jgi:hypothetical protein
MEQVIQSTGQLTGDGARFRSDRPSYSQMASFTDQQSDMFDTNEEGIACFCGD